MSTGSNATARAMMNKLQSMKGCSPPALLMSIRNSCTKLFVGGILVLYGLLGLSHDTNETKLRDAFMLYGKIIEVRVICDHTSAISKGFGIVRFGSDVEASLALQQMNGQVLDGREIRVHYANKK